MTRQPQPARPRFLSEADGHDLLARLAQFARGGGQTGVMIWSTWTGYTHWARNQLWTSGEVRNDYVRVSRLIDGAGNLFLLVNDNSDRALAAAVREAEQLTRWNPEYPDAGLYARFVEEPTPPTAPLFFETTYNLDAEQRAAVPQQLAQAAAAAGMLAAAYLEVGAHSLAVLDTDGHARYCQYTTAQYSMTVRDPTGTGSGWAGVDWPDWSRVDSAQLSTIALEKCLQSRNPVAIEPGRYTTILEPQAVCDFIAPMIGERSGLLSSHPANDGVVRGTPVIDPRLTLSADPTDPDMAFPPFNPFWPRGIGLPAVNLSYEVYHPATWIEHGILKNVPYKRDFARDTFLENTGLPNSGAFRLGGGETTIAEMIATTERGLLVTRFDGVRPLSERDQRYQGYTRDGVWLIEQGKITKAVKNLVFTESVLSALNNVEQVGVPQRAFHPKTDSIQTIPQPVIVPSLKIRDFSFTGLSGAV